VGPFLGAAFVVVVGVNGLVNDPHPFWVLWFAWGGLILIPGFRSPYNVSLDSAGLLHIRGITRNLVVPASEVRAIRAAWWKYYGYVLETEHTRVWFFVRLRNSFDLISVLTTLNPSLVIRGV
jgi:hypothetical protein